MNALALSLVTGMLAVAPAPMPRYVPLDPAQLILRADLIVEGVITHADKPRATMTFTANPSKTTFTIRVEEVLVGKKPDGQDLQVHEFEDWTCAQRYAPYQPGQRAIFHLVFSRDQGVVLPDAPLHVIGAGNEGESPLIGTTSFHRAHMFKGDTRERHKLGEQEFVGLAIPEAEYAQAARGLLRCYTWDRDPEDLRYPFKPGGLRQVCSDAELETFRASSKTAEQLLVALGWTLRLRDR